MTEYEPISLGHACEVKYQISRTLYLLRNPGASDDLFGMDFANGVGLPPTHIFDYQITPLTAVLAYLEQDFVGVFERDDLGLCPETGEVRHMALGTRHPHEFPDVLDAAGIDRYYPAARARFDYLAARFRALLTTPGRYLYICRDIASPPGAERLIRALSRDPAHQFRLLFVAGEPTSFDLSALPQVTVAAIPYDNDKPAHRRWEGDDDAWAALLRPRHLTEHRPALTA